MSHANGSRRPPLGRAAGGLLIAAALSGCGRSGALTDEEAIVRQVLALQTRGGPVCVDGATRHDPLAVYRQMRIAPRAARATLRWHPPTPLRPDEDITAGRLRRAELGDETIAIAEPPPRTDALPGLAQLELDGEAQRLMDPVGTEPRAVTLRDAAVPAGATARWWPLNRVRRDCTPHYVVSDVVHDGKAGFVTVLSDHWGTLYGLRRTPAGWQVAAEWSRWLY